MGQEIERKFLLANDNWRGLVDGLAMKQGYLNYDPACTVRVRLAGNEAFLTIKGKNRGLTRLEFDVPIPPAEAEAMLASLAQGPLVEKTRYAIPFQGHIFEVDEFSGLNQGLILAEVELASENEAVALPDWIGQEVSHDARYYNANLARHPFSAWPENEKA